MRPSTTRKRLTVLRLHAAGWCLKLAGPFALCTRARGTFSLPGKLGLPGCWVCWPPRAGACTCTSLPAPAQLSRVHSPDAAIILPCFPPSCLSSCVREGKLRLTPAWCREPGQAPPPPHPLLFSLALQMVLGGLPRPKPVGSVCCQAGCPDPAGGFGCVHFQEKGLMWTSGRGAKSRREGSRLPLPPLPFPVAKGPFLWFLHWNGWREALRPCWKSGIRGRGSLPANGVGVRDQVRGTV